MDAEAISWSGTVADGRLVLGDWRAWRWGRIEYSTIADLGACFDAIESGRCTGSLVPACALAYSMARTLFEQASAWPADAPGDELDSNLLNLIDHCTPLFDDPMVVYAIGRLRDCSDAHLYILQARELAARLFMEVRRIHRELAQREERLMQSLLDQIDGRPRLLLTDQACYGPGSSLLGELVLQDAGRRVSLASEPYHDLIECLVSAAELRERRCQDGDDLLVVPAWAVDHEPALLIDAACRDQLDAWLATGGRCWALVPRYAYRRQGALSSRLCRLGLERIDRLITETWTSTDPLHVRQRLEEQDGDASPPLTG